MALYERTATAQEMSRFGLTPEDVDQTIDVWPDNWQAVCVFEAMRTQWRVGYAGAYGLDYGVLPEIWRRTKTPPADRDEVFDCLRVLESAALTKIRKK